MNFLHMIKLKPIKYINEFIVIFYLIIFFFLIELIYSYFFFIQKNLLIFEMLNLKKFLTFVKFFFLILLKIYFLYV
jgi:hypothetical protein